MSDTELSVVCKSCGSEVSPYVTECPYCGTRLRKRAPKLERVGDEVRVREDRRTKRRRKAAERRSRLGERTALAEDLTAHAGGTVAALVVPAVLMVVERATNLTVFDLGAIVGPVGRRVVALFRRPVRLRRRRLPVRLRARDRHLPPGGRAPRGLGGGALLVVLGFGALGMLAAAGLDSAFGDGIFVAAGGNGIALGVLAAWVVLRDAERRADPTYEYDRIAVLVVAAVLLLLPAVEDYASVWAGLAGALVGAGCGLGAALGRR